MNGVRFLALAVGLAAVPVIAQDTNSLSRFEAALNEYHEHVRTTPTPTNRFETGI